MSADPHGEYPSSPDRPISPSEMVGEAIRSRIIHGDYPAGHRLTEEDLAAEHGVSRTSVREATRVLASQGFVSVQPYFGTFVAEMTPEETHDLLEVQGALEPLASRLAARRRTAADVGALKETVERGRTAAGDGRDADASALHGRFHTQLAAASGNDSLTQLIVALRDKLEWAYSSNVRRPAIDSWDEHAEMVDAIARGDEAAAAAAAKRHIDRGASAQQRHQG